MFEEARCVRCHIERPVELTGWQPGPARPMQAHYEDAPEVAAVEQFRNAIDEVEQPEQSPQKP